MGPTAVVLKRRAAVVLKRRAALILKHRAWFPKDRGALFLRRAPSSCSRRS